MTRQKTKEKAIKLRVDGYSYNYIANKLKVSKGTLSDWLYDIPYEPNDETKKRMRGAINKMIKTKIAQKRDSIKKSKKEATEDMGELNKRDLFMLGLGLYIGEGTKSHYLTRVINANPKVINLAIRWFEDACDVGKNNFRIVLHIYPDNDEKECLSFWSNYTKIPLSQFGKTQIDQRKKKQSKRGKLPYGTAHLTVKSNGNKKLGVFLFRKINAWMDIVLD